MAIQSKIKDLITQNAPDVKRVYYGEMPENAKKPCISYHIYDDVPGTVYGGAGGLAVARLQIDVWTEIDSCELCFTVKDKLALALHGYAERVTDPDTNVESAGEIRRIVCDTNFVGSQNNPELYHGVLQFTIQHQTPKQGG